MPGTFEAVSVKNNARGDTITAKTAARFGIENREPIHPGFI